MKLIKSASALLAATLLLGGISATASAGPSRGFAPVSFALTLRQQNNNIYTNATTFYSFTTVKLTNKDILNILADIDYGTNWASGAKLTYDGNQLVVLDKTGTNVLFYAYSRTDYGFISFYPFEYYGVTSGTYVNSTPGSEKERYFKRGYMDIYDSGYNYNRFNIYGYGLTTEAYNDQWTSTTDKGNESFNFSPVCTGTFDGSSAILTGDINGNLNWSGPSIP